jgi:hypothetical protein
MGGKQHGKSRTKRGELFSKARTARESFERGLWTRGEVGKRTEDGKLPPGATHEVVQRKPVRARYSAI